MNSQNNHNGNLLQRFLASSPQLSADTLLELVGSERLLIENHKGITQYGKEGICILTSYGTLSIQGCDLEVAQLSKDQVAIIGKLFRITLEGCDYR